MLRPPKWHDKSLLYFFEGHIILFFEKQQVESKTGLLPSLFESKWESFCHRAFSWKGKSSRIEKRKSLNYWIISLALTTGAAKLLIINNFTSWLGFEIPYFACLDCYKHQYCLLVSLVHASYHIHHSSIPTCKDDRAIKQIGKKLLSCCVNCKRISNWAMDGAKY